MDIPKSYLATQSWRTVNTTPCVRTDNKKMRPIIVTILSVLDLITGVQIDYRDICGQKLFETCPNVINTKIVGGDSTCAEKVPWNVLIENINGEKSRGR